MSDLSAIPGMVGSYWLTRSREAAEFRKTATIRAVQMPHDFRVATMEGVHRGCAGDWLAEGPAGELWPIKAEIFEATYELVGDPMDQP